MTVSCSKALGLVTVCLVAVALVSTYILFWLYQVLDHGVLVVRHAPGPVTIVREADTQILHIKGDDWQSIAYGQGFACAQSRLWQMEKQRRLIRGRLAELFGENALPVDEFMRYAGLARVTQETWNNGSIGAEEASILTAYANGVNDFVQGISLTGERSTARVLPPEFIALGITKESYEPWTPVDSMLMVRFISFHLTWNWAADLQREALRQAHPDLAALLEEIMPFTADHLVDAVSIVDDDDLKRAGMFSDEPLLKKYKRAADHVAKASPPLPETDYAVSGQLKDYLQARDSSQLGADTPLVGHQMASDNWVIHGDHTETGMPLFANDPQLANTLPSAWLLQHLEWSDGRILSGAQLPGYFGIGIGRTNDIVWGLTTSRVDTSDLWQERLNEDETQYFLDGEWRQLEIIQEEIKVKGESQTRAFKIKKTHRGPIIPYEHLKVNSALLFGGEAPSMRHPGQYSFSWQGQYARDDTFKVWKKLSEARDLPSLFAEFDSDDFIDYRGCGQNALFADTSGNIGYRLIMTVPERKDKTPFISSRVLDGTTSQFDWTGSVVAFKDLPKSLNPKKGYLMTANGRQTSDNAIDDYGASQNSPARALRVDEILREGIAAGKKFNIADMAEMQIDVVDVIARRVAPKIVEICQNDGKQLVPQSKVAELEQMLGILAEWNGSFDEDSIAATVYTRWYIQFIRNLFLKYDFSEEDRMAFSDNYHYTDAFQKIIASVLEEKGESHFQLICDGAYPESANEEVTANPCAYLVAMALLDTKSFLEQNLSSEAGEQWAWGRAHVMDYVNLPFSKTLLKPLFHRSIATPGNSNTPFFAKISERKNKDSAVITSTASGGYKMTIQLARDPAEDISLFSIDGGQHGNIFQGHYFDLNRNHLAGKLLPMRWNQDKMGGVKVNSLKLVPQQAGGKKKLAADEL